MRGASRTGLVVAIVLVLGGLAFLLHRVNTERRANRAPLPVEKAAAAPAASPRARATPVWRADLDDDEGPSSDQAYKADPLQPDVDTADQWAQIDFDEIRRALPDSTYWKMAFPTKDEKLLEERARIREEWNAKFGKVQSNTATDEEIDEYYADQQRLSSDYVEFLVYLAQHYGNLVPRGEVGALKLAGEMHLARLEEIPRKIAEAKERHAAHEKARQEWLAQQQQFATPAPPAE